MSRVGVGRLRSERTVGELPLEINHLNETFEITIAIGQNEKS